MLVVALSPPPPTASGHVLAALSLKGGVGKTSVVLGLAGAAHDHGLRTLVVDLDPQANATSALDPAATPFTSSDVLFDARPGVAREALVPSGWSDLIWLLPSERALEHRAAQASEASAQRLRRALQGVTDDFDVVLIDCPPSLGELTRNALFAADVALVVTEPSFFAVTAAQQALEAVALVRDNGNAGLHPAGIVANRVRPTLTEHTYRMDELRAAYGQLVLGSLPDRSAIQQAQGACVPVQRWQSNGATEAVRAFDALLRRLFATQLLSRQAPHGIESRPGGSK